MVKYCPKCGEQLIDNAKFCKSCGEQLDGNAPGPERPVAPVYEKSYTVHIVLAYGLSLFIPLLGFIMGVYLITRKDSEKANRHGKYAIIVAVLLFLINFIILLR